MNTAYQEVMLWNGQFGATGINTGTEASWTAGTPIATNELGYEGLEIQANVPETQLAAEFTPQNLSETQIDDLVAFLENGLNDPDLFRYEPGSVASGNCFPNNDEVSRADIGCE